MPVPARAVPGLQEGVWAQRSGQSRGAWINPHEPVGPSRRHPRCREGHITDVLDVPHSRGFLGAAAATGSSQFAGGGRPAVPPAAPGTPGPHRTRGWSAPPSSGRDSPLSAWGGRSAETAVLCAGRGAAGALRGGEALRRGEGGLRPGQAQEAADGGVPRPGVRAAGAAQPRGHGAGRCGSAEGGAGHPCGSAVLSAEPASVPGAHRSGSRLARSGRLTAEQKGAGTCAPALLGEGSCPPGAVGKKPQGPQLPRTRSRAALPLRPARAGVRPLQTRRRRLRPRGWVQIPPRRAAPVV